MRPSKETMRWRLRGSFFQFPMIIIWGGRGVALSLLTGGFSWEKFTEFGQSEGFGAANVLQLLGFGLMITCMMRIYRHPPEGQRRGLITSDVFAVTRHPMYHGMFIADSALFFTSDLTHPFFWVSWVLFVILLITAGWFQEKETLAQWGKEASEYYRRTPRFAFEWLWFWAIRPRST